MNIEGKIIPVIVERKKIKNIYFRFNDEGNILVSCPKYVTDKSIEQLLEKNRKSLERMYHKMSRLQAEKSKILYLGNEYDFVLYKKVMFYENQAFGPSIDAVNEYLEKNSLKEFQRRLDLYIDEFDDLPNFRLRIRKMKSRWGVCNKKSMTVTLNSLLIHKPVHLIDYVICHELSHFKHMDHSSAFWKEVGKHYPNYLEARKELRD